MLDVVPLGMVGIVRAAIDAEGQVQGQVYRVVPSIGSIGAPVAQPNFPDPYKNFSVLKQRKNLSKSLMKRSKLALAVASIRPGLGKIPAVFPDSRDFSPETGSGRTGSSASEMWSPHHAPYTTHWNTME